jgi:hypothetical protein
MVGPATSSAVRRARRVLAEFPHSSLVRLPLRGDHDLCEDGPAIPHVVGGPR